MLSPKYSKLIFNCVISINY